MHRQIVSSSNLKSVGYDAASHILEIEFVGCTVYQYRAVPEAIYRGLMSASSKGSYHHSNIKGRYPYTHVA